jgi:Zn-dependent peptidase ImmA (M78 family)
MTWTHSRIPKATTLPFGYVIHICVVSDEEFEEECGGQTDLAAWIAEERTIYLRQSRNVRQRRADLAHEIGHAFMDWQESVLGSKFADPKT